MQHLCFQAMTPAVAIDLVYSILKKGCNADDSDICNVIDIASALPAERDVHYKVCLALEAITCSIHAADAVLFGITQTLLKIMSSWPHDTELLYRCIWALYRNAMSLNDKLALINEEANMVSRSIDLILEKKIPTRLCSYYVELLKSTIKI